MAHGLAVERLSVAAVAMSVVAPAVAMAARAFGTPASIAVVAALGSFFTVPTLARRLPQTLDGYAQRHRVLTVMWCVIALAAVGQTARLAVFIDAPSRTEFSILPADTFWREHSCFSAYSPSSRPRSPRRSQCATSFQTRHTPDIAPPMPHWTWMIICTRRRSYRSHVLAWRRPTTSSLSDGVGSPSKSLCTALGLALVARFIGGREGLRVALWSSGHLGRLPVSADASDWQFSTRRVHAQHARALVAIESGQPAVGGLTLAVLGLGKGVPGDSRARSDCPTPVARCRVDRNWKHPCDDRRHLGGYARDIPRVFLLYAAAALARGPAVRRD